MAEDGKDKQPIIVIKKKSGHGGHHGGAWKVAYADFVTAMMAFFLVMWLVSQGDEVKKAVQDYFQDPVGYMKAIGKGEGMLQGGSAPVGKIGKKQLADRLEEERKTMLDVAKKIQDAIEHIPELGELKDFIDIEITKEGLRIQLIESGNEDASFFDPGSARLKKGTSLLLAAIAQELSNLPNLIIIEGHTDSKGATYGTFNYSNWELSADRANSARKLMESAGLKYGQIVEIRGFADRMPRFPANPADPRNRRVAIILLNEEFAEKYRTEV
ncbi:MAG: flagellar motor protein MotB [Candidatus Zixiibacteriota bacterium]